jgi:outer membrane lipoprotein-sorting protein
MKPAEKIKSLFVKSGVKVGSDFDNRILNDALTAFEKSKESKSAQYQPSVWRKIMKRKMIKITTIAAVLVVIASAITILDHTAKPAYAIEQTIEAMRTIKTVYFKCLGWDGREFECWIKVNPETGDNDCHYVNEPARGQISISTPEITYFYHITENKVRVINGQNITSDLRFGRFIEDMIDQEVKNKKGEMSIYQKNEPNLAMEVIVLWVENEENEIEAKIDPVSKLPLSIRFEKCKNPNQVVKAAYDFKYNVEIPDEYVNFKIPNGATVVQEPLTDTILNNNQKYGIEIGELSEAEAGKLILAKFWDAVIALDIETIRILFPYADALKWNDETLKSRLYPENKICEIVRIENPTEEYSCPDGPIFPCILKVENGSIKRVDIIVKFYGLGGKKKCFVYRNLGSAQDIE